MRLGIRTAISALVLTSIVVSAVGVHLLWWRTAHQASRFTGCGTRRLAVSNLRNSRCMFST